MIRINLLADRHAKDRLIIQQQVVAGIVIIIASIALCGFWWNMKRGDIAVVNTKIEQAKEELAKQKKIREQVKKMEARERRVKQILEAIEYLRMEKKGPVPYMDELNVLLPQEIWLTRVEDNNGSLTITGFSFSNTAVARLMKNMEKSGQFLNVELKEIRKAKVAKEDVKKFSVKSMSVIGKKLAEKKAKEEAAKKGKKKRR
ncbi:MAG: PilN domain-containing protein [Candidatus Nitrospinota bacterium M3_3B_026]